jgi:hypothetical protein
LPPLPASTLSTTKSTEIPTPVEVKIVNVIDGDTIQAVVSGETYIPISRN